MKKMVKMLQGGRTAAPARTRAEKRARGRQRRRRVLTKLNQSKSLYLFLIPAIVYFIIFCYLPMYGVQIAFKYYSPRLGIWGSAWTGMENLNRFFDSYYFWRLLRNTVGLSLYNLIVAFPFPILLALVFNEVKSPKLKKAVQTIRHRAIRTQYKHRGNSVFERRGQQSCPRRSAVMQKRQCQTRDSPYRALQQYPTARRRGSRSRPPAQRSGNILRNVRQSRSCQ